MNKRNLKFIIVDDELPSRFLIRQIVEEHYPSASIAEATDGRAALKLYDEQGADLMIIDYHMPFLSGTELVKLLRERKAAIPLVMVTNHPQVKSDAMFAGLTYFVDKGDLQHQLTEFLPVLLPK
jgi:two-component system response regulator DctR